MTNAGRKATVALVAAMAMMVAGQANAQDEPTAGNPRAAADSEASRLTIQLQLLNDANVPGGYSGICAAGSIRHLRPRGHRTDPARHAGSRAVGAPLRGQDRAAFAGLLS